MKTNHIGIALAWLATILLLTACGGSGSSSPSPAAPTGSVTITGNAVQYQTLTASNTLADANGLGTISYQWKANGNDITSATSNNYGLTVNEVGKIITVIASYTDGIGTKESVSSAATSAVSLPPIYTYTYTGPDFTYNSISNSLM